MSSTIKNQQIYLKSLWQVAMVMNCSAAVWSSPLEKKIHFLADLSSKPTKGKLHFNKNKMGFVVSPFVNPQGNEALFMQADIYAVASAGKKWKIKNGRHIKKFWQKIKKYYKSTEQSPYHLGFYPDTQNSSDKRHFIKMVQDVISAIKEGAFDKVIAARTLEIPLNESFDVMEQFYRLEQAYPDAFVSLISIPGKGTWMGASPELLVELSAKQLRTVSMAGTMPITKNVDLTQVVWNQKEIEEQAMVSRYIVEQFKVISQCEFKEKGPRSIRAGNMFHLKTEYTVDLKTAVFPEVGTEMLHLLHPTSAVCGVPKVSALGFIEDNEYLDREFYSGFFGPVNIKGVSRLYVNLRCMQILQKKAVLYAGAGITHDSIPEKEWDETVLKCQTLLNVMNGE